MPSMVLKKNVSTKHPRRVVSRRVSIAVKGWHWRSINPTNVCPRALRFPCKLVTEVITVPYTTSESDALYYSYAELRKIAAEFKQDVVKARKGLIKENDMQTMRGLESFVDPKRGTVGKQAAQQFVPANPAA